MLCPPKSKRCAIHNVRESLLYLTSAVIQQNHTVAQSYTSKFMNSYDEESSEANSFGSPRAFISSSNCEYELSGKVLKSSSSSSFGSTGDVGGVEKGFD
jgi:hypothetical protein